MITGTIATTAQGTLKLRTEKLPDGSYLVTAHYYDAQGNLEKTTTRIARTFKELLIG